MKKTIIAIGGGEIGRIKVYEDGHSEQKPIETMVIDKKIIELTGKAHPKLVFIGAASGLTIEITFEAETTFPKPILNNCIFSLHFINFYSMFSILQKYKKNNTL